LALTFNLGFPYIFGERQGYLIPVAMGTRRLGACMQV
jgi:hypothetical protein